jgi:hypothetical protein
VSTSTVTLPYLDLSDVDFGALTLAPEAKRWELLGRLFATCNRHLDDVPLAWSTGPLQAWCWLVLVENGLDHDDDDPKPLVAYGLDLTFAAQAVHTWTWFLA